MNIIDLLQSTLSLLCHSMPLPKPHQLHWNNATEQSIDMVISPTQFVSTKIEHTPWIMRNLWTKIFCSPYLKLDPASGSTIDWAYETVKVPLTYTYEFRDKGNRNKLLVNHLCRFHRTISSMYVWFASFFQVVMVSSCPLIKLSRIPWKLSIR